MDACDLHEWNVDAGGGSLFGELSYLVEAHTVKTASDAQNLVARMRQGERAIDDTLANLERGLASGRVAAAEKVRRAIEQLDGELAQPVEQWAMAEARVGRAATGGGRAARREVKVAKIAPAFARLRDAPARQDRCSVARTEKEGLAGLPDDYAAACYRAAIATHTGLPR